MDRSEEELKNERRQKEEREERKREKRFVCWLVA